MVLQCRLVYTNLSYPNLVFELDVIDKNIVERVWINSNRESWRFILLVEENLFKRGGVGAEVWGGGVGLEREKKGGGNMSNFHATFAISVGKPLPCA